MSGHCAHCAGGHNGYEVGYCFCRSGNRVGHLASCEREDMVGPDREGVVDCMNCGLFEFAGSRASREVPEMIAEAIAERRHESRVS